MEKDYSKHSPQKDVPVEKVIHYIVKDYRRMFNEHEALRAKIKEKENERQSYIDELLRTLTKKSHTITAQQNEIAILKKQIKEIERERDSEMHEENKELRMQLEEANRKIELLAKVIAEPEKIDGTLLQKTKAHIIETEDDKKWMAGAMKQLEKAAMKLISLEERLITCEKMFQDVTNTEEREKILNKIRNGLGKINSAVSHIECFFDKVGDISIID